jgi:hypothetical protein
MRTAGVHHFVSYRNNRRSTLPRAASDEAAMDLKVPRQVPPQTVDAATANPRRSQLGLVQSAPGRQQKQAFNADPGF